MTDTSGFKLLLALITFTVVGRGISPLHFDSAVYQDDVGGNIPVNAINGFFDNRLEGTFVAPHIIDTSLIPTPAGTLLDVIISATDLLPGEDWGGYQFTLSFDPAILMAINAQELYPFDPTNRPNPTDNPHIALDHIDFAAEVLPSSDPNIPPVGSSGGPIADITFVVVGTGVTQLLLSNIRAGDVYGHHLVTISTDGSFCNTLPESVSLNTIFVGANKYSVSKSGPLFDLTAQVTNTGAGTTMTYAKFVVYDSLGGIAGELTTTPVDITLGATIRLAGKLNVGGLSTGTYLVEGTVWYVDPNGAWVQGHKGSPTSTRLSMIKSFTLLP